MSEEEDYPEVERVFINTVRELASEFDNFDKLLVDTSKDWKLRLNALKRLEGIVLGGGFEIEEFIPLLTKLYLHLTAQLNDLRSAISKEACKLVCIIAEYGQSQIDTLCDKLISKQCLLKLVNSATKILSDNGHECVKSLLRNVQNFKVIPKIVDEANSKSTALRQKISEYMCIVVDIFEPQILEKYQIVLEEAICSLICDANKEVRQNTRQTFSIYADKFSTRGEKLFSNFDASVQKILVDEGLVDSSIYIRKTSSTSSATSQGKANQRPSSASAKKADMKSPYASPTATFGRASGSNGFSGAKMSESEKSSPVMTKSLVTPANEEKVVQPKLRQSDMYAEGKVGGNKLITKKLGYEKKSIEVSSADLKPNSHVPQIKQSHSLGASKSISDDSSTQPPTRASSKYASSQRILTAKDLHIRQESPSISSNGYDFDGSYQSRKEEDLYVLLDNAGSDDWAARANAFDQINDFISDLKPHEHLSNHLMDQLIQTHIQHINDHHYKVVVACQESFSRLITIYNSRVLTYLDQIIPQLFINLTEGKEKVSASTNFLINLINKIYSGDELLPHFLRSLDSYSKIKYKTSMVEFMNILIRNCDTYFNSPSAIKICVTKFANIISELTSNKSIVMPCLGMILYLRDINLSATIAAVGSLHNDLITKIRNLAGEYAPDLEENIQFYLQQTKGFTKLENRTSTSTSNSTTNSASKSDSINRYESHSNPRSQKQSTSDLRSKPIPSTDFNNGGGSGYNSRERNERIPVEKEVKKLANERQTSLGGRPVSASTAHLNKGFKTPRDAKGLPPTNPPKSNNSLSTSTTATIKSKSVQQSIQIENPSREESVHDDEEEQEEEEEEENEEDEEEEEDEDGDGDGEEEEDEDNENNEEEEEEEEDIKEPLQTDVDDFLEAESQAEKEILGEPQQRLAEIVKIETLVSEFPKNKVELQKKLKYVLTTLIVPNPSDDLKVYEYTLNILLKLLKLPLDFTHEIPLLISGIISLYNIPTKTKYSIEDILRAVLELGYIEASLQTLIECLKEADHPIVQIITKNITKLAMVDKNQTIMNYLPELMGRYKGLIQHANPDVRKNVVFSVVELYFINQGELQSYIDDFSPNHQKLISIYIQKKNEGQKSTADTGKK